ncbi:Cupredoxin [Ramicandelaber brevisporus]|nr:Cupredoxin [Ramicandelaber brevisporus]
MTALFKPLPLLATLLWLALAASADVHRVYIANGYFTPRIQDVKSGDIVEWVFSTTTPTTVVQGRGCVQQAGGFRSTQLANDRTFQVQFKYPGKYDYFSEEQCKALGMSAQIWVDQPR